MLHTPMDVLTWFPVRRTKAQKEAFRTAVQTYAQGMGYAVTVEAGSFGAGNIVIGDPEKANYLVTAHYDTCARMPVPNFCSPCHLWLYCLYRFGLILLAAAAAIAVGLAAGLLLGEAGVKIVTGIAFVLLLVFPIIGPANSCNANDNTSGVVTVLEIARTMPENRRNRVCFVLFDLEEAGLIGSGSYRKMHTKATNSQLVLNLDCVGDGDKLLMFPSKLLREDKPKLSSLYRACGYFGKKSLLVYESKKSFYPSDQLHFPWGVGICALKQRKKIPYLSGIHTPKDNALDETNVNILRAALTTFICCDEVNEERK